MPKRKAEKAKVSVSSHVNNTVCDVDANRLPEENASIHKEAVLSEPQHAASRAIAEVEIQRLLTNLRLLKSTISKEHLMIPLLQYFKEHLPHLTVSRTEKDGVIDVQWKDKDTGELLSMNAADGGNKVISFLQLSCGDPPARQ